MINAIVCVDKNWGIGKNSDLLFTLPKDMKFFRETTKNNIVVMGYTTYMSLPNRPLKNRVNVVLWDKATSIDCLDGCITFNDFNQLLNFVQILAPLYEVFIIGGQSIYKLFNDVKAYDKVYVTKVDSTDEDATAFFPNLDSSSYLKQVEETESVEDNGYSIKFVTYTRGD